MVCKYCEKEYSPEKRGQKSEFCSKKCADNFRYHNSDKKNELICQLCGQSFRTNNLNQKYCSYTCSGLARAGRTQYEKTCAYCSKSIITIDKSRKYCSAACASRANANANKIRRYKTCKYCGKQFHTDHYERYDYCSRECSNNARYGTLEERKMNRLEKGLEKLEIKNCIWCGNSFTTARSNKICCSKSCSYEYRKKKDRDEWQAKYVPKQLICKECGSEFITTIGKTRVQYCSERCATRHQKKIERKKYGNKYSKENKKRREKQIKDNFVAPVWYEDIYERDAGICKVCGMIVSNDIDKNSTWGGTIDHIIPLSKGGTHEPSNCQLAHRICNSLKSDLSDSTIDWQKMSKENNYWKRAVEQFMQEIS